MESSQILSNWLELAGGALQCTLEHKVYSGSGVSASGINSRSVVQCREGECVISRNSIEINGSCENKV